MSPALPKESELNNLRKSGGIDRKGRAG